MNDQVSTVAGGYVLVPCIELCRTWAAYRAKTIRLYDVRVWLACHELVARRCMLSRGRSPRFTLEELHVLVGGVGGEHLRNALKRLAAAGLFSWSAERIEFVSTTAGSAELAPMLHHVANHRRVVPVPRRMLRVLAQEGSRSLIATALGHLLRCLYLRGRVLRPIGACKSSWIAVTFGIDLRNAKAARHKLVALGWLVPCESAQWYKNRYGTRLRINTEWAPADGEGDDEGESDSPLPRPQSTTKLPLPVSNRELLAEYKNQKPTARGPAGACSGRTNVGRPTLKNVVGDDLRNGSRLLVLFREAVRRGLVAASEADRLRFFTAAEHARSVGTTNVCGLFVHLVKNKLWHYLTQADEDAARKRLQTLQTAHPRAPHSVVAVNNAGLSRISDCLPNLVRCSVVNPPMKAA